MKRARLVKVDMLDISKEKQICLAWVQAQALSHQIELTSSGILLKSDRPQEKDILYHFDVVLEKFLKELKHSGFKQDLLWKACGGKKHRTIWDVTGGMAQDSLMLLALGFEVRTSERHPLARLLLLDGFERMQHPLKSRWQLVPADQPQLVDVIYYDPMFHEPQTKSLPHKEMRIFRSFIGGDEDQGDVGLKLRKMGRRLVIKRPLKAPLLLGPATIQYKGKSIRYDVYL